MRAPLLVISLFLIGCPAVGPKPLGGGQDTAAPLVDADGDGSLDTVDCDDADADIHPGATEVCDGIDNDCDGSRDGGAGLPWYTDADGDGFGDAATELVACDAPSGTVANGDDCDDTQQSVNPSATEECDGEDDDCDGEADEDVMTAFYADGDADGYGDAAVPTNACAPPDGYVAEASDCDDADATIHPGAAEWCDGLDDDCDGATDEEDAVDPATWYADADADGFGDAAYPTLACAVPDGSVGNADDCDDADADSWPGATETCDGEDQDCDGTVDEDAADATIWYADSDGDGYAGAGITTHACDVPAGYLSTADDCDDADATVSPGATESCDGRDDDCDGATDESGATGESTWFADADADGAGDSTSTTIACDAPAGYVAAGDDCDDGSSAIHPGAVETCDAADTDEDCDGLADDDDPEVTAAAWVSYADLDLDGYGDPASATTTCDAVTGNVTDASDCDDADATIHPAGTEVCNDLDDDCDGSTDEAPTDGTAYFPDADGDGFGDPDGATANACAAPVGYRLDATDCDDTDPTVHPYAWDADDDGIDGDCDGYADDADPDVRNAGPDGDDEGALVTLSGTSFPFCGDAWTTMYMQSNGRVTFDADDGDLSESQQDLDDSVAVAVAWDDLRPGEDSTLVWIEHADAVALHWVDVPEFGATDANTFSVVLFDDGRILLQYGGLEMRDGLAGYSCAAGHSPTESDLSAEMAALGAGRWGVGTGTDEMVYERFTSDNDLDDTVVRLCGNADGATDPCAE